LLFVVWLQIVNRKSSPAPGFRAAKTQRDQLTAVVKVDELSVKGHILWGGNHEFQNHAVPGKVGAGRRFALRHR
jgi:hypothetical protein